MIRFPYKLWLYWQKCGFDCIVNYDPRRVNKRSFKRRNQFRLNYMKGGITNETS